MKTQEPHPCLVGLYWLKEKSILLSVAGNIYFAREAHKVITSGCEDRSQAFFEVLAKAVRL